MQKLELTVRQVDLYFSNDLILAQVTFLGQISHNNHNNNKVKVTMISKKCGEGDIKGLVLLFSKTQRGISGYC